MNMEPDFTVKIANSVNGAPYEIQYGALFKKLRSVYDISSKSGAEAHEVFQANTWLKPHFDYEQIVDDEMADDAGKLQNLILTTKTNFVRALNELFHSTSDDYVCSDDSRWIDSTSRTGSSRKRRRVRKFKISFHVVMWTKKVNFVKLGNFMRQKRSFFDERNLTGLDFQIYRNGQSKFRLPMTKRSATDMDSLLKPEQSFEIENFHKHIVQYITPNATELEIEVNEQELYWRNQTVDRVSHRCARFSNNCEQEIQTIVDSYNIISTREHGNDCVLMDVKESECPNGPHRSNHNFLCWNKSRHTLKLKCHDEDCEMFEKILYRPSLQTQRFDLTWLHNIPLLEGQIDNYQAVKCYVEQFFIFIRDSATVFRVCFEYSQKYDYLEKKIKAINLKGYENDVYFRAASQDPNEPYDLKKFWDRYKLDMHKQSYLDICFQPYGTGGKDKHLNKFNYNLFQGFNYPHVLTKAEKDHIPQEKKDDFEFFLTHIRDNVCGFADATTDEEKQLAEDQYTFLMSYFANMIQNPTYVTHIMLIFFSRVHGTGKSGLTKLLCDVLGSSLSFFGSFDQITEKHTNAHVGKLFNVIEEVNKTTSRKYHNVMKDYSQRERAVYNEKHRQQCTIRTYVRYILTTNYSDGVWFDGEDRRYVLYNFKKIMDPEYVARLIKIMTDKYTVYQFGKMLEEFEIPYEDQADWQNNRPLIREYFEMRTQHPITQFLTDLIQLESISVNHLQADEFAQWPNHRVSICKERLYDLYLLFYNQNNCLNKLHKSKLHFVRFLHDNYSQEVQLVKIKEKPRKKYYMIRVRQLWLKLLPSKPFINVFEHLL